LDIEERPDEPQRLVDSNHTLVRIAWAMERLWEPHFFRHEINMSSCLKMTRAR